MTIPLDILSIGAVTAIGLDSFQTASAFRARLSGFRRAIPVPPPEEALRAAKIPVHSSLRESEREWLVNMAVRAIKECLGYVSPFRRLALLLTLPEAFRMHPGIEKLDNRKLVAAVASGLPEATFCAAMPSGDGGAGISFALQMAKDLMMRNDVDACVIGGVDSLLNSVDVNRLRQAGRMLEPGNSKGLIPGEGACMAIVAPADRFPNAIAVLHAYESTMEEHAVTGCKLSQGRGFETAINAAFTGSGLPEQTVSFRVSTVNGEHYSVWESMFYSSRVYRTRRESFPVWYTASSIGEMGAASGALAVVLAALGIAGGYAPGPFAMAESASDTGLRSACLIGPAKNCETPPFRPEEGASTFILRRFQGR